MQRIVFQFEANTIAGDDSYVDRLALYADALLDGDPEEKERAFARLGTRQHPIPQRPYNLDAPPRVCTIAATKNRMRDELRGIVPLFDVQTSSCTAGELTTQAKLRVFETEGYRCRYCGSRTVDLRVLELMARVSAVQGNHFVLLDGWRLTPRYAGERTTDLAFWRQSATVDHIHPRSRCGLPDASHNLCSACWPCQARKANWLLSELGWQPIPPVSNCTWDGLVSCPVEEPHNV